MALEPRESTGEEINPELVDMTRRFWISVALTLPILLLMVSSLIPGDPLMRLLGSRSSLWLEIALATGGALGGWPFFQRDDVCREPSPNMFT
jgi:Cu+-exporting ATPase